MNSTPEQNFGGHSLDAQAVRHAVVTAQRIPEGRSSVSPYTSAADVLRGIGLIQLDPLTRVSTAQRLTCLTRLPKSFRAENVDAQLWPQGSPVGFEAFTKVACLFPLEDWPLLRLRREKVAAKASTSLDPGLKEDIRAVVSSGSSGVRIGAIEQALGQERTTGWNWSTVKQAAELMVRTGELVITAREGVVRLFDLPERALPAAVRDQAELSHDELLRAIAIRAVGTLAVMTVRDLAHHYHLSRADAKQAVELAVASGDLVEVEVQGWKDSGFVAAAVAGQAVVGSEFTSELTTTSLAPVNQARLVGPFDPLLRDRDRMRRIFGFDYTFEAYVPKAKRVYGHYVMAVLSGDQLIGRVDLQRTVGVLQVNQVFAEPQFPRRSVEARAKAAASILARQLGVELTWPDTLKM